MELITPQHIEQGRAIVAALHWAIIEGDNKEAEEQVAAMKNLVVGLNGGTLRGTYAHDKAPGPLLMAALKAEDGQEPLWGQPARFLVSHQGVVALVDYGGVGFLPHRISFCAVERGPFISSTGYRSHKLTPLEGHSVKDMAERYIGQMIEEGKLEDIGADDRALATVEAMRGIPWIAEKLAEIDRGSLPHEVQLDMF